MYDGYPTEEELEAIRSWPVTDPAGALAYIKKRWGYDGWKEYGGTHHVSTFGWSGNEDMIDALAHNVILWDSCWRRSERGGRYVFVVRTEFGSEEVCDECHSINPVWRIDHEMWSAHSGGRHFLCPSCFIINAEADGFRPRAWRLVPERGEHE